MKCGVGRNKIMKNENTEREKQSNFDRIKAMNVEELAEFMHSAPDKICFENCTKDTGNKFSCKFGENVDLSNCIKCMKQYLESEVENNADSTTI